MIRNLNRHVTRSIVSKEKVLEIIRFHDTEKPLFLLYAFHLLHLPLQVPQMWLRRIDDLIKAAGGHPIDSQNRRLHAAMTLYMDAAIERSSRSLKEKRACMTAR